MHMGTQRKYVSKLSRLLFQLLTSHISLYPAANVREYWIVDPMKQTILAYDMEDDSTPTIYSFTDIVKVHIYDDLSIHFFRAGFWYLS